MKTGSGGRPLKIIIFALLVVVGALIAVQIRSVRAVDSELDYAQKVKLKEYSGRIESLSAEIDELERSTASMNYRYSARLEQLSEKGGRVYEEINACQREIDGLKALAGLTDRTGDGVVVTVSDSAASGQYEAYSIVHDSTLLSLVNTLKGAGAEAISVNDQRITAMSEFICVGPAVRVNGTKLFAPFVIKALGDQDRLETAVAGSSVARSLKLNLVVTIEREKDITVPAFSKAYQSRINMLGAP